MSTVSRKPSGVEGTARSASYAEIVALYNMVGTVTAYRDWDWLDRWLRGIGAQNWPPRAVLKLYNCNAYWDAVVAGDSVEMERVKNAVVGNFR